MSCDLIMLIKMMEISVHCVFGESDAKHVQQVLVPSLLRSTEMQLNLRFLNYTPGGSSTIQVQDIKKNTCETLLTEPGEPKGFAANHNILFEKFPPSECFLVINPDCVSTENLIERLVARYKRDPGDIGLVEASQWPYKHPKEFDMTTGETPWASGACVLVNSAFYSVNKGMDEGFFLYAEDVDLSWACWLAGYKVVHEPLAKVVHFTNAPHENRNSWSLEYLYGLRNHVLLTEKYFGASAMRKALNQIKTRVGKDVFVWLKEALRQSTRALPSTHEVMNARKTPQIKIYGKGLYHRMSKS